LVTSSDSSLSDYLHNCLEGQVYDRVATLTGYERDRVKSLFLAVIYGEPKHMHTRVGEAIRELYPDVFDAVAEMNARDNGNLPRLMQTMESGVMIGRVAARLLREYPSMPLLTVHDSVLVPEECVEVASRVISEEWLDEFGIEPNIKHSNFTSPQSPRLGKRRRPNRKPRTQPQNP
jgi:hypothetical protein